MKDLFDNESKVENSPVLNAAYRLAIIFSEEKDIPAHYRKSSEKQKKTNEDSLIMKRFMNKVNIWKDAITMILERVEPNMAWRFINLNPRIEENIKSAVYNKDFIEFTNYFVQRRDIENCDYDELGCLAELYTGFQRKIDKEINKSKPDFVAIDFEHATRVKGTICSVGIVSFKDGEIVDKYYSLVKPPENEYEWFTVRKHKLNSHFTENAPTFNEIFPEIHKRINNNTVVAHGAFHTDKVCLEQAMSLNDIEASLNINWVCTQQICDCGLAVACKVCNIELSHHDALSDAIGCGLLFSRSLTSDLPINEFQRVKNEEKIFSNQDDKFYPKQLSGDILKPDFENAINNSNPFFMKKVVISGFSDTDKDMIACELKELGADIDTSVGNKTNFLIAGDNVGPSKLSKMQANIDNGKDGQIISFLQFNELKKNN